LQEIEDEKLEYLRLCKKPKPSNAEAAATEPAAMPEAENTGAGDEGEAPTTMKARDVTYLKNKFKAIPKDRRDIYINICISAGRHRDINLDIYINIDIYIYADTQSQRRVRAT